MKTHRSNYRFSVVIPCYNEADYITQALKSLNEQTTKASFEVIVVDNNCTDDTALIAKSYGARVVSESTPGVCAARQAGTQAAKGEIVISTDADTKFKPDWLAKIDDVFKKDKNIVVVGGPCRYYDGPWWGKIYTHFLFNWTHLFYLIKKYPVYLTATNIAFKRNLFEGYDLNLMQGGDELGLLHQMREKGRVVYMPKITVYTSGRRLVKGALYSVFVSFFYYYLAAYYINSIFNKHIIGRAPAFRGIDVRRRAPRFTYVLVLLAIISIPAYMNEHKLTRFIYDNTDDIKVFVSRMF